MFIQTELTPNPSTLKFLPGRVVMEMGTAFYKRISECTSSPLAQRLFSIEGVAGVFFKMTLKVASEFWLIFRLKLRKGKKSGTILYIL